MIQIAICKSDTSKTRPEYCLIAVETLVPTEGLAMDQGHITREITK